MKIFDNLNSEQKEAVTFGKGPLLIVAGAGTGKTTVITQRLAWLIQSGKARPEEILALTFTDKAAGEMEERVDKLLPYGYVDFWVSTFHSFGERILRDHALEIGLDSGFKILSVSEQWLLIRQNLDQFDLDYYKPLGSPTRFIQALIQHFSRVKDENIAPEEYLKFAQALVKKSRKADKKEEAQKVLEVAKAYKTYNDLLIERGDLDFGDLIIYTLKLFQKRKSILEKYRKQFKYILVDEFQDTNFAQYEFLKLLAAPKNNITVCGDDDQSIYKFRGASISNILEFKRDFPASQEVVLIKNYRSKQNILDLAYDFIQLNNPNRLEYQLKNGEINKKGKRLESKVSKKLIAVNKGQGLIQHIQAQIAEEEVMEVLREIIKLKKENPRLSWNDFAILVRANNQADILVNILANQDFPFQFIAARGLYQKPEILDLISYLKMLDNYYESTALYRILNLGILNLENKEIIRILNWSNRKRISLYEALEQARNIEGLESKTLKIIDKLLAMVQKHTELAKRKSVGQVLFQFITDIHYMENLTKKDSPENNEKILNINKFFKKVQNFEQTHNDKSVKNFIEELDLVLESGEDPAPVGIEEGPESIKIMTVHGAKGLEFTNVFIVQLVDKRFPSIERREIIELPNELVKEIIPSGDIHLQEERRLFYVAMTRVKERLYFTSAEDYGGVRKKRLSRFLLEIDMKKVKSPKEDIKQEKLKLGYEVLEKEKEKVLKREILPSKFSFTQLKAFTTCPKQYRYAHILRVPAAGKPTFSFGKSLHNTLRDFYLQIQKNRILSKNELIQIYEANWIDDWYDTKQIEQNRKKAGLKALEKFYEDNKKNFQNPPKFIEKSFNIKIGDYTLKGVIDRVDYFGKEGVEIIDYKTGQIPKKESEDDLLQLLIYAIATKEVFQDQPQLLTYYYLEGGKRVSQSYNEKAIKKVKEKILKIIDDILASDFKATPSVHKCKYCDFNNICEDRAI